ncbi:MAG: 3'(2'),5'-bisphosphate nucleotidase CysQ [Acidimicrobiales bacterium]|jgi:3'(2'), 5'-bisphosphate nucleotidase|nr:3'(2'),5'-bisphosphate nucleotidase CysQ [Acidimicrobiales bacterium]
MATPDDHVLAEALATQAGELLLEVRDRLVSEDAEAEDLRKQGDRQAHAFLMESLAAERPGDAVLSEEGAAHGVHPARSGAQRVWIIDPLDGTREFSEPPRTDWAVHVALAEAGLPTVGAVALPALGVTLATGSSMEGTDPVPVPPAPRIVVSRTRPPAEALAVAEALGGVLVEMGSAGAKAMAVVRGEADVYVHSGGQFEWDNCAPVAVAASRGLHTSRLDGSPLTYNHADPYLPDLVVCRAELADAVLATLSGPTGS